MSIKISDFFIIERMLFDSAFIIFVLIQDFVIVKLFLRNFQNVMWSSFVSKCIYEFFKIDRNIAKRILHYECIITTFCCFSNIYEYSVFEITTSDSLRLLLHFV